MKMFAPEFTLYVQLVGGLVPPCCITQSSAGTSSAAAHFGLGADIAAKSIEIIWPSGLHEQLDNVKGDQILRIEEPVVGSAR
jgi:ASPIC and UnbV